MQMDEPPVTTDLVLVGGWHSHLFVYRKLAMQRCRVRALVDPAVRSRLNPS